MAVKGLFRRIKTDSVVDSYPYEYEPLIIKEVMVFINVLLKMKCVSISYGIIIIK